MVKHVEKEEKYQMEIENASVNEVFHHRIPQEIVGASLHDLALIHF